MRTGFRSSTRRSPISRRRLAALTALVLLGSTQAALANLTLPNPGSAGIRYAVESVNPAGGDIYDPNTHQLVNIGGFAQGAGYGSLVAPVIVSEPGGGIGNP